MKVGDTVTLDRLTVEDENCNEVEVSGSFYIEDYQPYEPAAGITSSFMVLGEVDGDKTYTVDPDELFAHVDPAGYAKMIASEESMFEGE